MADPERSALGDLARENRAARRRVEAIDPAVAAPLDDSVYEGLAGFRGAMRRFLAFSEAKLTAAGITSQQYQAMLVIKVHPTGAIMIRDLAGEMLLQPNGAVQLVDRLVNAGLVERRQSPDDRRSVLVTMTAEGSRLLELLAADHMREMLRQEPLLAESLRCLRHLGR
ncbi:MarR family transcriptional regulator [Mesorhizobium sp. MSK_1335]|uniref:MarR family transcriptional regulator n=1 Tax=Mesorhizobium montanum TaxID=3072323 RepID=A0ABU4ZQW6_9HYPH|nr:MarR family transcriptional regulator [Mesorhizobium sp. MSK_1335]MDX8527808.1 MarR family transcriptional regulator [Mesorhizobium sp. MSK_1335]